MQQCPNCGHRNRAGIVFCENCGASLIGKLPLDTKTLDSASEEERSRFGIDPSVLTDVAIKGASTFAPGSSLRLEVEGSPDPIVFEPKSETIFGRRDPATGAMPDIDLTPYAGYRMGVSRRHAALRLGEGQTLDLWDLGSSNGTFLNGQRLNAHRPYRIQDNDEIRLGQMVIRVHFPPTTQISSDNGVTEAAPVETAEKKRHETEPQPGSLDAPIPKSDADDQIKEETAAESPAQSSQASASGTAPLKPFKRQLLTDLDSGPKPGENAQANAAPASTTSADDAPEVTPEQAVQEPPEGSAPPDTSATDEQQKRD